MPCLRTQSNTDWHYQIQGEGPPLLFLHGWSVDSRIWRQQLKFFKEHYRVIAIDLPGHGQSGWQKISLSEIAEDIQYILTKENVKEVNVIGSSLGGLVALKLYAIFQANIKKMIFVGSMPKFAKSEHQPYGLDIEKIRKLSGQLETDYTSILSIFFRSLFTREERQTRRFKWIQKFRKAEAPPMKAAMVEYLDILEQEDLTDVLKRVQCPMQFINGDGDEICNQEAVDYLKKIVSQARFDMMNKRGHFPFLSTPEEFNVILKGFLDSA